MNSNSNLFSGDYEDAELMQREIIFNYSDLEIRYFKLKRPSQAFVQLLASVKIFFMDYFSRPLPLWYLFVSSIQLALHLPPEYPLIAILSISTIFSLYFNMKPEVLNYFLRRSQGETLHLVWEGNRFINKKRKDLIPGEIILVMQNEIVPADVLLIANGSSDKFSYFDMRNATGQSELVKKVVVKDIQNLIESVEVNEAGFFINTIEASISINEPCSDFNMIEGKIKIRSAPASIRINFQSFVLSESVLKFSPWIFAIVLYSGSETKTEQLRNVSRNAKSKTDKISNNFQVYSILLVTVLSIVNFLLSYKGSDEFLFANFLSYFTFYTFFIPLPFLFIPSLALWIQSIIIHLHLPSVSLIFPGIIQSLGQVDYLILNKTGLIQDPEPKVKALLVDNVFHLIDHDPKTESSEQTNLLITEPDTSLDSIRRSIEDNKIEYFNFARGLVLCTKAIIQRSSSNSLLSGEDRSILNLVNDLGINITNKDHKKIVMNYNNVEYEYKILAFRSSSGHTKKVKILVENSKNKEFLLYVRGPWDSMNEFGNSQVTRSIEKLWLTDPGVRILAYGYLVLTQRQAESFMYNYNCAKATPINKEGRIQAVFEVEEQNLNWLGFVGLEERINKRDIFAINEFKNAGVKVWLTSADDEECSFSTGLGSEIIDKALDIVKIPPAETTDELCCVLQDSIMHNVFMDNNKLFSNISVYAGNTERDDSEERHSLFYKQRESVRSIQSLRRTSLHPLISQISNVANLNFCVSKPYSNDLSTFVLILDGKILELAFKSAECLKLLSLLMFVSKTICFYEMMPHHNSLLNDIMKNCFSFDPIYLGFSDKSLGIRIGLKNEVGKTTSTELKVGMFNELKDLILFYGLDFYLKISKVIKLGVFCNFVLACVLFVNFYFTGLNSAWVLSEQSVYFLVFGLQSLVYLFYMMNGSVLDREISGHYRQIYQTGILEQGLQLSSLYKFAFTGTLAGLFTYFLMMLGFFIEINRTGQVSDNRMIEMYLIIVIGLSTQICSIIDSQKISLKSIILQALISSTLLVYVLICNYLVENELFMSLSRLFNSPSLVISLILNTLWNSVIFYFQVRWNELFSPSLLDMYRSSIAFFSVTEFPSRQQLFEDNLERAYKKNSLVDATRAPNENPINPYQLEFYSANKESEYNRERSTVYRRTYRTIFTLHILIYISIFIYAGLTQNKMLWQQVLLFCSASLLLSLLVIQFTPFYRLDTLLYLKFLYPLFTISTIIGIFLLFDTFSPLFSLFPISFIISCTHWWKYTVPLSYVLSILDIYYKSYTLPYTEYLIVDYSFCLLSILTLSAASSYLLDYNKRQEFLLVSKVALENSKANDVLQLLLPSFVINNVKRGIYYISIDQGIVSVLFCNICDFEDLTSELTPLELTSFLDELYGKFDQLCEMVGVSKIETVGKTYMASAGIKDSETELDTSLSKISHARRIIELAFGMLRIVQKTYIKNARVHVKIGINSGPVRAGVVGFHKPQFSLVGDTVNVASRMASTIRELDSIQISSESYEFVKECTDFTFAKQTVEVKGRGNMYTYFIRLMSWAGTGSELASDRETFGSLLKDRKVSCGVSTSFISMSAMSPGEFIGRKKANRNSRLLSGWSSKVIRTKTSEILKNSRILNCSFKLTHKENEFRLIKLEKKLGVLYIGLFLGILTHLAIIIEELAYMSATGSSSSYSLGSSSAILISFAILIPLLKLYNSRLWFGILYSLITTIPVLLIIISDIYDHKTSSSIISIKVCFHILLITQCSPLLFSHQIISLLISAFFWLVYFIIVPSYSGAIPFFFILLSEISAYVSELKLRIYSKLHSSGQKELKKLESLLTQMVPPHAYEHLKAESTVIDKLLQVTLLYADIVGFTAWSSRKSPEEVVKMLNELFTRFDKMCVVHSVYKVHTIGDCYVAMGNAGSLNRDIGQECVNVLQFASKMIEVIQDVNNEYNMGINMRIGVHTGDVIAGITGKSIVRYDIYGNDVYIANTMESNGLEGYVSVSKTTMNLVKNFRPSLMNFESHKTVEVFGENVEIYLAKFN